MGRIFMQDMLMQNRLALPAAKEEIHLIGDGSFLNTVCLGSWAFVAPDLGLQNVGSASGEAVDYFETLALLSGLSAIQRIDRTSRPIAIATDSKCAFRLLSCAADREPLPPVRMFNRVRSLYGWAESLAGQRAYSLRLIGSSSTAEHKTCHRLSVRNLRARIAADPALARLAALRGKEQNLRAIKRQLVQLQEKALVLKAEMEALQAVNNCSSTEH